MTKQEIAKAVCERIADGESLTTICNAPDAPVKKSTFLRWVMESEEGKEGCEGIADQYARAMAARTDLMAEEILEIADRAERDFAFDPDTGELKVNGEHIQRAKLMVDTRRWLMAKRMPKKYGDKVQVTNPEDEPLHLKHSGGVDVSISPADAYLAAINGKT